MTDAIQQTELDTKRLKNERWPRKTSGLLALAALLILFIPLAVQEQQAAVIAAGDHGRDLYLADQVAHGKKYLRDFSYIYGPLSLEVDGLLFRVCGPSLKTALRLRSVLLVVLVIVAYFSYRSFASPFSSAIGALLTGGTQLPFWFTFNHILVTIGLVGYIGAFGRLLSSGVDRGLGAADLRGRHDTVWAYVAALAGAVVLVSKLNIGIALLGSTGAWVALGKLLKSSKSGKRPAMVWTRRTIATAFGLPVIAAAVVYSYYLVGSNPDAVRQSFPYSSDRRLDWGNPFFNFAREFHLSPRMRLMYDGVDYIFFGAVWPPTAAAAALFYVCVFAGSDRLDRRRTQLTACCLGIMGIVLSHEWLLAGNVYPIIFYGTPVVVIVIAMALDRVTIPRAGGLDSTGFQAPQSARDWIPLIVGTGLVVNIILVTYARALRPTQMLSMPRGAVGVLPPDVRDERTVELPDGTKYQVLSEPVLRSPARPFNDIHEFITQETQPGEPILSAPYAGLHNFLADRPFPTRHIDFLKTSRLQPRDEQEVIDAMTRATVRLVLVSNHVRESFGGLGDNYLPTTCPLLWKHIIENYEPVGTLGDFSAPPMWVGNYGVIVFWKKPKTVEEQKTLEQVRRRFQPQPNP